MENRKVTCCKVEGCESPGDFKNGMECFRKGYCNKHYLRLKRHGDPNTVLKIQNSGKTKHTLYPTWKQMKARTSNPSHKQYPDYGGRRIKMCDRWQGLYGFDNFLEDMGERPPNHTLDRTDNDGDYSPENCRWATGHQQCANRRNNNEIVGVSWCKRGNKWRAQMDVKGKHINLGQFTNYEDAVAARKASEVQYNIFTDQLRQF